MLIDVSKGRAVLREPFAGPLVMRVSVVVVQEALDLLVGLMIAINRSDVDLDCALVLGRLAVAVIHAVLLHTSMRLQRASNRASGQEIQTEYRTGRCRPKNTTLELQRADEPSIS